MSNSRCENGTILIISLWILAILSMFAIAIGHKLSLEIRLLDNHLDSVRAFYIAEAGIKRAIAERQRQPQNTIYSDSFNQPWLNNEAAFKDMEFGAGVYTVENPDAPGLYGMSDEQSKVNINTATASFEILKELLREKVGSDEEAGAIAAAIIDWRDQDDEVFQDPSTKLLIGAEYAYYLAQDPPYKCKNSDFDAVEELLLVKGITPEIFYGKDVNEDGIIQPEEEGIKRYITVYGNGTVNINTADKVVLIAVLNHSFVYYEGKLPVHNEQLAEYIVNFRQEPTGKSTGKYFVVNVDANDPVKTRNIYAQNDDLKDQDIEQLWNKLKDLEQSKIISVTSSTFRINSAAQVKGIKRTIEAVAEFNTDGTYGFAYWNQE